MYRPLQPDDEHEEDDDVGELVLPEVPPGIPSACETGGEHHFTFHHFTSHSLPGPTNSDDGCHILFY